MIRRGFIFTLDALLSIVLISVFIVGIVASQSQVQQIYKTYSEMQDKHVAEGTLSILRTVPLRDLVPQDVLKTWVSGNERNTTLYLDLVSADMSPLDIVATYWATAPLYPQRNLRHKAEIILGYILNRTLQGYNYELLINNYTSPYLRKIGSNYSKAVEVSPATLIMSGYAYNQTPRGYMARAYLTKVTTLQERLYGWMRVLADADYSRWGTNTLTIIRTINLPSDAQILASDGKFVARQGEKVTLYINEKQVGWDYGQININDLNGYLTSGSNIIKLVYSDAQGNEIGSASGTTMYVKYKTSKPSVEDPGLMKVYDVTSARTGFMYLFELFVPGNITNITMHFKIRNIGKVRLYYGLGGDLTLLLTKNGDSTGDAVVEFSDTEIRDALDRLGIKYQDLSKMVFDFVVGFDAYYEDGRWYYEGGDYYNDTANRERKLYGYPDSYVSIKYKSKIAVTQYSIPLSIYFPYGDNRVTYPGRGLRVEYNLPPNVTPWYADFWVGYLFSGDTTQKLLENNREFYSGPLGRYAIRVAYTRLYDWMMVPGNTNVFEIKMSGGGSKVRDGETRGTIKYFLEAYAPYSDIFPKLIRDGCTGYRIKYYWIWDNNAHYVTAGNGPNYCDVTAAELLQNRTTYAVDDAVIRLFNNLGGDGTRTNPILVQLPANVNIDFASMGNIPGLFKPIQITLRVWREG